MIRFFHLGDSAPTEEERQRPLYLQAFATKPDPSWGAEVYASDYPLYGYLPSMQLGVHRGWTISGKQYPREAFYEHHFAGDWTGAAPVGLTPVSTLE